MTLVVIRYGEDHVQDGVDPEWNVAVHTADQFQFVAGMTFIRNLQVGTIISHVPTQPQKERFIIRLLKLPVAHEPMVLVVIPAAEERQRVPMAGPLPPFEWPRRRVSVWDLIRKPSLMKLRGRKAPTRRRKCASCRKTFCPRVGDGAFKSCAGCRKRLGFMTLYQLILWAAAKVKDGDAQTILKFLNDLPYENEPAGAREAMTVFRHRTQEARLNTILSKLWFALDSGDPALHRSVQERFAR